MTGATPILISTMHYHDALGAGTIGSLDMLNAARRLGADGVEYRADSWRDKEREIVAVRRAASARG